MKTLILLLFLLCSYKTFAQVSIKSLTGEWLLCGTPDSIKKSRLMVLHNDLGFVYRSGCCKFTGIQINKNKVVYILYYHECTDPGIREKAKFGKLLFDKKNGKATIVTTIDGEKKYKIVSVVEEKLTVYPFNSRVLVMEIY